MSYFKKVLKWFEERLPLGEILSFITSFGIFYSPFPVNKSIEEGFKELKRKPLPYYSRWPYFLGIIIFLIFIFQAITGILLALYYIPSLREGYKSTLFIIRDVPLGYYVFNIHRWGAFLLIIFIILRLLRFIYHKVYHPPRELFWVLSFLLFVLFSFQYITGTLLSLENRNYWETIRIMEIIKIIPLFNKIFSFIFGEWIINDLLYTRFYIFHIMFIPSFILTTFYLHFMAVRKVGLSTKGEEKEKPLTPDYFWEIFIIFLLLFGILLTLSTLLPFKYTQPYDPFKTPDVIPLPFFLLPFHFLKAILPPLIAGFIILFISLLLLFIPWLDRSKNLPLYKKPLASAIFLIIIIALILMGIAGFYRI